MTVIVLAFLCGLFLAERALVNPEYGCIIIKRYFHHILTASEFSQIKLLDVCLICFSIWLNEEKCNQKMLQKKQKNADLRIA